MTLCVAAECKRHKRFFRAIVFATDFQMEAEVATAEIARKMVMIGDGFYPILLAGSQSHALGLIDEINRVLFDITSSRKTGEDNCPVPWEHVLRAAVLRQKHKIANDIVSSSFGLTYSEFLEKGKTAFPDDIYRETIAEIARTPLGCWLLVLSFAMSDSRIFRISETGAIDGCEHFAAIGSGYYIAEASLFQRTQNTDMSLAETIYNVFEAMKLGSIAPGVGERFEIGVAEWEWDEAPNPHNEGRVKVSFLEPPYYQYLRNRFSRFGPKPVTSIRLKPRLIKEQEMAVVLTPKADYDPEVQACLKRTKIARDREARKKQAKQLAAQSSPDGGESLK